MVPTRRKTRCKAGRRPDATALQEWGHDPQDGQLTMADAQGAGLATRALPNDRGNYLGYYMQLRDAIRGLAPNPVPAEQALEVMRLLDLGRLSAMQRRELACPAPLGAEPATSTDPAAAAAPPGR
jgi:predicted dehydrogenase